MAGARGLRARCGRGRGVRLHRRLVRALLADRRLLELQMDGAVIGWMPVEYHAFARLLLSQATVRQAAVLTEDGAPVERSEVLDKVTVGWMESIGPTTADELAQRLHFDVEEIQTALLRLEAQAVVFACFRAELIAGRRIAIRTAMMPITTNSSTRVNARREDMYRSTETSEP